MELPAMQFLSSKFVLDPNIPSAYFQCHYISLLFRWN